MRRVMVVPYDLEWPRVFESLRDRLTGALGALAVRIEHVGSTAVPGLCAKPIVDIDVVIASADDSSKAIERLEAIGYTHRGDRGIPGREAFEPPAGPAHHLYVCADGAAPLREHLTFRDYLRGHPESAEEYGVLKRELAERFVEDRLAYQEGKRSFVESVMARLERDDDQNPLRGARRRTTT